MYQESDEELLSYLRTWIEENKETFGLKKFSERKSRPSITVYFRRFGTWKNAVHLAGFEVRHNTPNLEKLHKDRHLRVGNKAPRWDGGRNITPEGYIALWVGKNVAKGGYVLEHRQVMSSFLGRSLLPSETVHHKNGDRKDNRLENLELWDSRHPSGQRVEDKIQWAIDFLFPHGYDTIKRKREDE